MPLSSPKKIPATLISGFWFLVFGFCGAQTLSPRQSDPIPTKVETLYTKGLNYLAKNQTKEGNWSGGRGSEPGVVGLCTVAFLAKGEDPNYGRYAPNIKRAINYLLKQQNPLTGYIGNSMYNHGFATLALAESAGMVDDDRLTPALQKAVQLILNAQKRNPKRAWRYSPEDTSADSTVSGCQIVALLAARNAGIPVPDTAIQKGLDYMKSCRDSDGGYGYTSPSGARPTLTAIGSLCYSLAKEKKATGYKQSLAYLKRNLNYRDPTYPYYFEYYMSQALFHADEDLWSQWNTQNIRYFAASQQPDGAWPGGQGPAFNTAGALLSLALNYRFLPIYEK